MKAWSLRQIGERALRFEPLSYHVEAIDSRRSGIRMNQAGEHFDGGAFAGAVRTDETYYLTWFDIETKFKDPFAIAKVFR